MISYESYYKKALQIRRLVQNDFEGILRLPQLSTLPLDSQNDSRDNLAQLSNEEKVDAVLTPTAPTPAFTLESAYAHDNPVLLYLNDVMTIPANMAGTLSVLRMMYGWIQIISAISMKVCYCLKEFRRFQCLSHFQKRDCQLAYS